MRDEKAYELVQAEVERAISLYPAFRSHHEGYAIIKEEVEELWEIIKRKPDSVKLEELREEAVQTAAMALRFLIDLC